jgi:hypothetical protein
MATSTLPALTVDSAALELERLRMTVADMWEAIEDRQFPTPRDADVQDSLTDLVARRGRCSSGRG